MSIQTLDFAMPLYEVVFLENEDRYFVAGKCLVFNLAERAQASLKIKNVPLAPLKGTIVKDVWMENITQALVVKDYDRRDINDPSYIAEIKHTWKSLYEYSGLERHKGIPYYKSPKVKIGAHGDIQINFCYAEPNSPSGPHRDHDRNFDEVHAQIRGIGKMMKFETSDIATFWGEQIMAPGTIHEKMYDENGMYPWHQYCSITGCIYMPIEIDR